MLRILHAAIVMVIMPIGAIPSTHTTIDMDPSSIVPNGARKAPSQKDLSKQGVGRSAVRRVGALSEQLVASPAVRRVGVQVTANGKASVGDEAVRHAETAVETKEELQSLCSPEEADFHLVFSTGCTAFQHWQAEVLLNSAYHVGQCGKVTRIVVGCDTDLVGHESDGATHPDSKSANRKIGDEELMQSTFPNLLVHHAPAIPQAKKFPWFNKPWSFFHWLQTKQNASEPLEKVIAILDPDQFFMRPLRAVQTRQDLGASENTILHQWQAGLNSDDTIRVEPGMALAQTYGLGTSFMHRFDRQTICNRLLDNNGNESESPCASISEADAHQYSAGPPYLIHRDDFSKAIPAWWKLMDPVYEVDKGDIQADMFAYIFGMVHHKVQHTLFTKFMVSNVDSAGEGWPWVDALEEMSCTAPAFEKYWKTVDSGAAPLPDVIHSCTHFKACADGSNTTREMTECSGGGDLWNFHKGHVPGEILECDHPLLMAPPEDLINVQIKAKNSRGKRGAFMICAQTFMVNRAALDYKKKYCKAGHFNDGKCTRIYSTPKQTPHDQYHNPFEYPLAMVKKDCNVL
jgi:hypothetical protein